MQQVLNSISFLVGRQLPFPRKPGLLMKALSSTDIIPAASTLHLNDFFLNNPSSLQSSYGLIALNSDLPYDHHSSHCQLLKRLWDNMNIIGYADGGSNRIYFELDECEREKYIPHFIAGDLDSILPEVQKFYE